MKSFFVKAWAAVKAFFAKLAEFLENPDGGFSSRRLGGVALITVSVVLAFKGAATEVVLSFLGTGATLIGLTTNDNKQYPVA
jgi:hypothetical protein